MDWEELLWLSASWAPNRVRVTLTYAYAPFLPKYIGAATMTTYAEGKRGRPSLQRWSTQQGQAFLFIVILIAFFLLAVLGLATDYTQVWAHRQMAQGAAESPHNQAAPVGLSAASNWRIIHLQRPGLGWQKCTASSPGCTRTACATSPKLDSVAHQMYI